jgi:hydrogenase nickel incorporation protein HypA/HybF
VHEVSLCRSLASAVGRAAAGRRVTDVFVDVGALRQVVPDAMSFAWTFVVRGTALDGAGLHLNAVPAVLACDACGARTALGPELGFGCRACGSARTHLASGEEFTLTAIDVTDLDDTAAAVPAGSSASPDRGDA